MEVSPCAHSTVLYGSEIWRVKEQDVIRLERNDARMVKWMCNVKSERFCRGT